MGRPLLSINIAPKDKKELAKLLSAISSVAAENEKLLNTSIDELGAVLSKKGASLDRLTLDESARSRPKKSASSSLRPSYR
jgi:hypothetical protein